MQRVIHRQIPFSHVKKQVICFCFVLLILFFLPALQAQQLPAEALSVEISAPGNEENPENEEEAPVPMSPERQRMEMELKTSTLPELAVWCRSLGLAENGTREELVQRLRQHLEIPEQAREEGGQKVIIVNSAQTSEYFKIEVTDEEYARLRGDVSISMKDGDHIHAINAQEILFNRTRNTLTARGGVVYSKTAETDGTVETFRGENITVNIDTWAAVFLDGDSERALSGDDTAYRFAGAVISRTDEDTTILRNAVISNAASEEPYWSITASRLWLLPGSDFAFVNAVLKVGEIPLLWLPFFFYPADELIFHPVIGYRSKEGAFIQTTTYILGRPKTSEDERMSITKILGSSNDMETERQGIFLRSTGKKAVNPNETSLRLLLDYYVNMGGYAALELSLPGKGIISQPFNLSLGFGFTRTLFNANGHWTPYNPNNNNSFDWNHSGFFSNTVSFRYRINFSSGISMRYGSFWWELPYYSDPFVNRDFDNRAESMDWVNFMEQSAAPETSASSAALGSPQWSLSGNINPNVGMLSPYISRISISTLSTSLTFRNVQDNRSANGIPYGSSGFVPVIHPDSPVKQFFVPDTYTIYNISASVSGAPLSLGRRSQSGSSANDAPPHNIFDGIGDPISPWEDSNETASRTVSADILTPPVLSQKFTLPGYGNLQFNIDYNIKPTSSTVLQFRSGYGNWKSAEEVDWSQVQSVLTSFSGNADINFHLNHSSGLYSNTLSLTGGGTWRDFTYLNEEAEAYRDPQDPAGTPRPELAQEARQLQYGYTGYSTSYIYKGTVRPLLNNSVFNQSNLQYDIKGTLISSRRYDRHTSPNGPELTPVWGKFAKEKLSEDIYGINSHRFTTYLSANVFRNQQVLSLFADLPPLDPLISANASFKIWYSETSVSFRYRQMPDDSSVKPGEWVYDPVNITQTFRYKTNSLVFNMLFDPEDNTGITNLSLTLSLWSSFTAAFNARRTPKAELTGGRWVDYGSPVLQPEKLAFSFRKSFRTVEFFKGALSFTADIDTSLTFELIKYTNSSFKLTLGPLRLRIFNILELSLEATSDNSVIMRYFRNFPGMDYLKNIYPDGPQNNVFIDLIDSFNFGDNAKRRRSGFKMRSFDLTLKHFLGDWEAELRISMSPYKNESQPIHQWEIGTDFGFFVRWNPISEIKTSVEYKGEYNRWTIQ